MTRCKSSLVLAAIAALPLAAACSSANLAGSAETGKAGGAGPAAEASAPPEIPTHLLSGYASSESDVRAATPVGVKPLKDGPTCAWRSEDPAIAAVDAAGHVRFLQKGRTKLLGVDARGATVVVINIVVAAVQTPEVAPNAYPDPSAMKPQEVAIGGGTITIRRPCHVAVAWNNAIGPAYLPDLSALPPAVTVTRLDLFRQPLQVRDLAGVDVVGFSDAPITAAQFGAAYAQTAYRPLTAAEGALLHDALGAGTGFVFASDNGDSAGKGDANAGTRQALRFLTPNIATNPAWVQDFERSQKFPADAARFPFLAGVVFDFTPEGLNTPTDISRVEAPATCVLAPSGKCRVAWQAEAADAGFIFVNGNAGVGDALYFGRLLERKCQ